VPVSVQQKEKKRRKKKGTRSQLIEVAWCAFIILHHSNGVIPIFKATLHDWLSPFNFP
jgi:hypothetical protein